MDYNEELKVITKDKEFNSFWEVFDYLMLAGYKQIDALALSLKLFDDKNMWDNTAYVRLETHRDCISYSGDTGFQTDVNDTTMLVVGVLDENTSHLDSIFSIYRKKLSEYGTLLESNSFNAMRELEDTVTKYTFILPEFYLFVLNEFAIKYYGFDMIGNQMKETKKRMEETANLNSLVGRNIGNNAYENFYGG